ncbi:MAG: hypothetical protein KDC83_14910 [Flavobacteriales bacterium]|nr:hypothetical protein [Flavobacteriales bacterium]
MDQKFEFYKEVYFFEHQRKTSIQNAHSIPIGIITVLIGAISFFVNDLINKPIDFGWLLGLFYLLLFAAIWFIGKAFFLLFKTYTGNKYQYIPNLDSLHTYEQQIDAHYKKNITDANIKYFNNLKSALTEAATFNADENRARSSRLFDVNKALFRATIILGISAIPFFSAKLRQVDSAPVHQVKIINLDSNQNKIIMATEEENNNDSTESDSSDSTSTPEPNFPTNIVTIEGNGTPDGSTSLNEDISDSLGSDVNLDDLD